MNECRDWLPQPSETKCSDYAITLYSESTYTIITLAIVKGAPNAEEAYKRYKDKYPNGCFKGIGVVLARKDHYDTACPIIDNSVSVSSGVLIAEGVHLLGVKHLPKG